MKFRAATVVLVFCCVFGPLAGLAFSQVGSAEIVGTVIDATGAAIPNAQITIKNIATGITRIAQSGTAGDYSFTVLPVGTYSLSIAASGFKVFRAADVTLAAGDHARVDAQMEVGTETQSVTVEASSAPVLQTDSSTVGGLIQSTSVQDLPTNGRNFVKLVQLAPGASEGPQSSLSGGTRPDDRRQTSTVVANGQNDSSNNYILDGVDDNERSISTVIVKPSIDSLEEVKVDTNLYSADIGRNGGAVITMVTKSGSNDFHGDAFEFLRNDKFDAKDAFNTGRKPEYRQNQFGGSFGGPIKKNKTFFFADYEALRIIQGQTQTAFTPTPCELGYVACNGYQGLGNFSDLSTPIHDPSTGTQYTNNIIPTGSINSIAKNYAALYPDVTGCTVGPCPYTSNFNKTQYFHTGDLRIDEHLNARDNVFGRYTINNGDSSFPGAFPAVKGIAGTNYPVYGNGAVPIGGAFPGSNYGRQQNVTLGWDHVTGSNIVMDVRLAWSRYVSLSTPNNAGHNVNNDFGGPGNVNIAGFNGTDGLALINFQTDSYSALGDQFALPTDYWDQNGQIVADLTWIKGPHTFRFGGSLLRRTWAIYQQLFKGEFSFSNIQSGNSFASFLAGSENGVSQSLSLIFPDKRDWEVSEYAQDDWRLNHRLTLNLGIRYDVFTPFTERHGKISDFDPTNPGILLGGKVLQANVDNVPANLGIPTQYNMFQPRVGFAATFAHDIVLRGGVGDTYYVSNTASPANLNNAPFGYSLRSSGTQAFGPALPLPTENPANACLNPNVCLLAPGVKTNSVGDGMAYNFRNAMVYMYNLTLEKAFGANDLSVGWVGEPGRHLGRVVPNIDIPLPPGLSAVPGCQTGTITLPSPCQPFYGALPITSSVQLLTSTGSSSYNALNVVFTRRYSKGWTVGANYTWAHALANVGGPGGACGTCAILPNNLRYDWGNSDYDVKNRMAITINYELPFGKSFTGVAKQVVAGWQMNAIYAYASGLPFTVSDSKQLMGIAGVTDRPNMVGTSYLSKAPGILPNGTHYLPWVNPADFVAQTSGTPGNEERNQFFGPNTDHMDFSLFKDFPIAESKTLQFRAEVFNLSNTPNYAQPGAGISGYASNPITAGTAATNAGNFGYVTATSPLYTPREIQFALKLLF